MIAACGGLNAWGATHSADPNVGPLIQGICSFQHSFAAIHPVFINFMFSQKPQIRIHFSVCCQVLFFTYSSRIYAKYWPCWQWIISSSSSSLSFASISKLCDSFHQFTRKMLQFCHTSIPQKSPCFSFTNGPAQRISWKYAVNNSILICTVNYFSKKIFSGSLFNEQY